MFKYTGESYTIQLANTTILLSPSSAEFPPSLHSIFRAVIKLCSLSLNSRVGRNNTMINGEVVKMASTVLAAPNKRLILDLCWSWNNYCGAAMFSSIVFPIARVNRLKAIVWLCWSARTVGRWFIWSVLYYKYCWCGPPARYSALGGQTLEVSFVDNTTGSSSSFPMPLSSDEGYPSVVFVLLTQPHHRHVSFAEEKAALWRKQLQALQVEVLTGTQAVACS